MSYTTAGGHVLPPPAAGHEGRETEVRRNLLVGALALLAACDGAADTVRPAPEEAANASGTVETTGKIETPLGDVPEPVLAAAKAAQPTMTVTAAEAEVRDGRNYFDIEGRLPDGAEIELDLMEDAGTWRVVETQRDIGFAEAPEAVRAAFTEAGAGFTPVRVIESRQNDGLIIYELFGPSDGGSDGTKVEVKYDGRNAEVLTEEWAH